MGGGAVGGIPFPPATPACHLRDSLPRFFRRILSVIGSPGRIVPKSIRRGSTSNKRHGGQLNQFDMEENGCRPAVIIKTDLFPQISHRDLAAEGGCLSSRLQTEDQRTAPVFRRADFPDINKMDPQRLRRLTDDAGEILTLRKRPSFRSFREPLRVPRSRILQIEGPFCFLSRTEGAEIDFLKDRPSGPSGENPGHRPESKGFPGYSDPGPSRRKARAKEV